jgi:hypothetical protein
MTTNPLEPLSFLASHNKPGVKKQPGLFQMNALIKQDKVKEEVLNKTIKSLMTEITIEKNKNSLIEIDYRKLEDNFK